ncbi:MAG: hypothetical protein KAS11_03590 [Candidatus Aenigmarchaeota archaeon]|nr:hypothetical protein [Candidatus Aenigmarchaeota archaeon]MCK4927524.1 hypothetical protein [Candidatus Aenigmarchaeota archaeon]
MSESRPDLLSAYLKITEEIAYKYVDIVDEKDYMSFISSFEEVLSYLGMCIDSVNQGKTIEIYPLPAMSEINEILADKHKIKNVDNKYFFLPDEDGIVSDEKGWRHYKENTIAELADVSDKYKSQEDLIRFANIDITGSYYLYPLYVQEEYIKNNTEDETIALAQIKQEIKMPAFKEKVIKQKSNGMVSGAIDRVAEVVNGNKNK